MPFALRHRALTLLEVLLVVALLGVLFAVTLPSFSSSVEHEQLNESAMRMKALVGMCRAQAMNESRRYRLIFEVDGSVRIE
ncbi:MAG: prepilin-type N-terminal cleavage/methylation domain-containing protein, partial [Planctomycetota bacterium]